MNAMQIDGLGLVGGFGCGVGQLKAALERGWVEPSLTAVRNPGAIHELPLYRADTSPLEHYLNKRVLRRIDHFSRLALLGAFQALEDAQTRQQAALDKSRLGVVLCSGFGALNTTFKFLDSVIDDGDSFASPTAFSNSVHNAAAAHISMQLGISGPGLTLSQFDHSFAAGLSQAQQWLDEQRVDAVLLGVVDEYSSVLGYCWERLLGVDTATRMCPFGSAAPTAIPGEGAAFFVLRPQQGIEQNIEQKMGQSYATIQQVASGNLRGSKPQLAPDTPLILGCEGYPPTLAMYQEHIPVHNSVACYTPLYGASPVASGFDVAVAALALQGGELSPSTGVTPSTNIPWRAVDAVTSVNALACVDFGVGGEYSVIQLQC